MDTPKRTTCTPGHNRRQRASAVALVALLVASTVLSGCLDLLFPQREEEQETHDEGLLRVWVATRPGAVGNEFVHYNITFGGVAHARDLLLEDLHAMELRHPSVDLVRLERERQTVEIARAYVPDGEYSGFGFYISHASLAIERVVGNEGGRAVTQIEESPIDYSSTIVTPRATHVVFGGRVTDLFIEIDLQRSLQRGDSGMLRHTTVPAGVSVHVDNTFVKWHPMDGGASRLSPDDPRRQIHDSARDRGHPPTTSLQVFDAETEARYYFDRTQPNKRINRAFGIGEDILFDASRSESNTLRTDIGAQTVDYIRLTEHRWDFSDGTTMTGSRVTKNFTQGGLFDVTLTVRDANDNIARDHVTLFVPYTLEQAVATRTQSADGLLPLGAAGASVDPELHSGDHSFTFPEDLDGGDVRIGAYRVQLTAQDPFGGNLLGLQSIRVITESGHFQADELGLGDHDLQGAGIPIWRGPLKPWVDNEIDISVQLVTGLFVEYELTVEAHYYHNLSRGLDPHPGHIHADWPFGPKWDHLRWDGSVHRDED